MPEELSATQLGELRRRLQELQQELAELLAATAAGVRPVGLDEPIGRLSRMDALQQQSMAQASRSGLENRQRQVAAALAACDRGDYGLCRECEEPIGFARLRARPETHFCLACQSRRETRR